MGFGVCTASFSKITLVLGLRLLFTGLRVVGFGFERSLMGSWKMMFARLL